MCPTHVIGLTQEREIAYWGSATVMDPNSSLVKPLQRGLGFPMLVDHPVWSQRGVFGDLNAAFNADNEFDSLRGGQ